MYSVQNVCIPHVYPSYHIKKTLKCNKVSVHSKTQPNMRLNNVKALVIISFYKKPIV